MKIKFLSVIVSFFIVSITVSSCLKSDDTYEYNSDATIHAFGIDTIYGKYYKFSIDQLNRVIYNKDSLPIGADTIIDRILIDTLSVNGWVSSGAPDTLFNMADSVNLIPAMNKSGEEGMKFRAHAADGVTVREYTLQIRVHKQDPDSLMWQKKEAFSTSMTEGAQKAVILNDELWVYTTNTTAYKTSTVPGAYQWSPSAVSNLPSDAKLTSALNFQNKLYIITEQGELYSSTDATTWTKINSISQMQALVACFTASADNDSPFLVGIQKDNAGKPHFCSTTDGENWTIETEEIPEGFPTENISSATLTTANGINKVMIMGMPQTNNEQTIPWSSIDGKEWASLATSSDAFCPGMTNPSILYYGDKLYSFGDNFEAIYSSLTGIAWYKTEKKFLLPESLKNKKSYSMTVDKNNFIWLIIGGNHTPNEVWRGRLNRLGFKNE